MEVKGSLFHKKGVIIDEKRLNEIQTLLLQYCERIEYSAELENDTKIDFDDYGELINYENYNDKKIKKLNLHGYKDKYLSNIDIEIGTIKNVFTFVCFYKFSNLDEEEIFKSKVNNILKKSKNNLSFLGKISLHLLVGIICIIYTFVFTIPNIMLGNINFDEAPLWVYPLSVAAVTLLYSLLWLIEKLCQYLFPVVVFKIGEEIENFEKKLKWRFGVLWTVIIGGIVSMGTGIITNLL